MLVVMTGTMKIGLILAAGLLASCLSGVRVRSAAGGSAALASLSTFAVIQEDSNREQVEELFVTGQVATKEIESHLRQQLAAALVSRGYQPAGLDKADFAVSVDANYYAKSQNVELEGTRSFLGTGNRQKSATVQQRELSIALDFIDLRNKKIAWRITAKGPPPTPEEEAALTKQVIALVGGAPSPAAQ